MEDSFSGSLHAQQVMRWKTLDEAVTMPERMIALVMNKFLPCRCADLSTLTTAEKNTLVDAAKAVRDLPEVKLISNHLSGDFL
jgi:hypothetical protein